MNDDIRLMNYKMSLKSAWGYNDYNDWPIKVNSVMHMFLEQFAYEFISDMEELNKRKVENNLIAKEFVNPARLFRIIDPVIFGMKRMKLDIAYQRQMVLQMLDIVKNMKYGSEFNEDGINLILSPNEVDSLSSRLNFKKVDNSSASIIQRFCGIMWAYTEAVFFRAHDVTKEIHGPYKLSGYDGKFIVREYLNLRPNYIWGDNVPFIPYQNIKIYTKYRDNLKVTIDSYNHLFLHEGNYVTDLDEYALEADDKSIEIDRLMEIIAEVPKTIGSIHKWVECSDWRTIVNRYAVIFWYRKSPLRNLLDMNWEVPEKVRENISVGNVNEKRLQNLSKESIERLIRIVI